MVKTIPKDFFKNRLIRHRLVLASCFAVAVGITVLGAFDATSLLQTEGTVDSSFKFTTYPKRPKLRPGMAFTPRRFFADDKYDGGLLRVQDDARRVGFVDCRGSIAVPLKFADAGEFTDEVAPAAVDASGGVKWGVIDAKGEWVVSPQFSSAPIFYKGSALLHNSTTGNQELVDQTGRVLFEYSGQCDRVGSVYVISDMGKFGLIDAKGQSLLPQVYDGISKLHNSGRIEECTIDGISIESGPEDEQHLLIEKDQQVGLVDSNGRILCKPKFEAICSVRNNHLVFRGDTMYGVADLSGAVVIPPKFDFLTGYDKVMVAGASGDWSLIDGSGKPIAGAPKISGVNASLGMPWLSEGLGAVLIGDKFGYVDECGKLVIKPQFSWAGRFHDGRAAVWDGGALVHYIDTTGKPIGPHFASISPFVKGTAKVSSPGILYFIKARDEEESAVAKRGKEQISAIKNRMFVVYPHRHTLFRHVTHHV